MEGAEPVLLCVVHSPGCRYAVAGNVQKSWSVPVIVASVEKNISTSELPPCVPWLHSVAVTVTWEYGDAPEVVPTDEMTKSGAFPMPTRFPARALLSSNSSGSLLNGSTMAPTY